MARRDREPTAGPGGRVVVVAAVLVLGAGPACVRATPGLGPTNVAPGAATCPANLQDSMARGRDAAGRGDPAAARRHFRRVMRDFGRSGAPYGGACAVIAAEAAIELGELARRRLVAERTASSPGGVLVQNRRLEKAAEAAADAYQHARVFEVPAMTSRADCLRVQVGRHMVCLYSRLKREFPVPERLKARGQAEVDRFLRDLRAALTPIAQGWAVKTRRWARICLDHVTRADLPGAAARCCRLPHPLCSDNPPLSSTKMSSRGGDPP